MLGLTACCACMLAAPGTIQSSVAHLSTQVCHRDTGICRYTITDGIINRAASRACCIQDMLHSVLHVVDAMPCPYTAQNLRSNVTITARVHTEHRVQHICAAS